jgi:hypothetical protein
VKPSAASPEHEFEAQHGLPEALPPGERILWQGAPVFGALLARAFHFRSLIAYFALILAARAATVGANGGSVADSVVAALWLLPAAALALGLVAGLAWLTSRTTAYTITDKRVVLRVGIVLTVTFNLPFSRIEAAVTATGDGPTGDIALAIAGPDRIAYLHLWPHVRPWHVRRTQPMLRCIADAPAVARLLADAWSRARGIARIETTGAAAARSAPTPRPAPAGQQGFSPSARRA